MFGHIHVCQTKLTPPGCDAHRVRRRATRAATHLPPRWCRQHEAQVDLGPLEFRKHVDLAGYIGACLWVEAKALLWVLVRALLRVLFGVLKVVWWLLAALVW